MDVLARHNVVVSGRPDGPVLLFAHGFGCDQHMWRGVAPAFEACWPRPRSRTGALAPESVGRYVHGGCPAAGWSCWRRPGTAPT